MRRVYNGAVLDRFVNRAAQLHLERDKRGSNKVKKEAQLVNPTGKHGLGPLIGCLSFHPC